MTKTPKVTVILTSYNHANYLRESIDSVLQQTFTDFELLILDDASMDDSWQIINSYSDPRIRAFQNEINRLGEFPGLFPEKATGEFIAIHHSDDVWEPEKLEKQVHFLDDHPEVGAVFTNAMIIGERGEPFEDKTHFYYHIFDQPNRSRYEWLNFFFYHGNALCHPSVLIRRLCYENCGTYRRGLAQTPDFDMWIRLCLKYEIHVLPEKLVRFRVRSNEMNASGDRPATHIRGNFEFIQVLNNYRTIQTSEEFLKIFPNASEYFSPEGYDIDFALAMVALQTDMANIYKFFGLQLLFDAINDPDQGKKINSLYNFGSKEFIFLTFMNDVFSSEKEQMLQAQTARAQVQAARAQALTAQVQAITTYAEGLAAQGVQKDQKLQEMVNSKAWKLALILRKIRLALIPRNSLQEKPVRYALALLRKVRGVLKRILLFLRRDLYYLENNGLKETLLTIAHRITRSKPSIVKLDASTGASLQKILECLNIPLESEDVLSALITAKGRKKTSQIMAKIVGVEKMLSAPGKVGVSPIIQTSQLPPARPKAGKGNILFITGEFPSPYHGGGNRVLNFIKLLSENNNIYLCTCFFKKEDEKDLPELASYCHAILKIPLERFGGNQAEIRKLIGRTSMDIVHYEWPRSLENYDPGYGKIHIFTYMEAVSLRLLMEMDCLTPLSTVWLEKFEQLAYVLQLEFSGASRMDARIAVTRKDAEFFRNLYPFQKYAILNHGVNFEDFVLPEIEPEPHSLVFVGNYRHYPNVDALEFFFNEIWESILKNIPDVRINLVGAHPPENITRRADGEHIFVIGEVADVRPYIQKASVCIAPLISGVGLRGKVLEYAALRRPFVATSLATTDLIFKNGIDYLCADTALEFSEKVIALLKDPQLAKRIADAAYETARQNYDTKRLTGFLLSLYDYVEENQNVK